MNSRPVQAMRHGPSTAIHRSVSVYRHPAELPAAVQQLLQKAEADHVEVGMTWYCNLIDTVFANHSGVQIYVLCHDETPVVALPVLASKRLYRHRVESLGNYYTAIYAPVIAPGLEARDLIPLFEAIRRENRFLSSVRLAPMDPQSASYRLMLEAMKLARMVPFEFYCFGNWYLNVEGDWAAYLKGRGATLRSNIKRANKKFVAEGGTLELVRDVADIERGLKAYERVYAASWKGAEPFPDFVPGLVRACAGRGWLRLGVAWLKGEPIAAQLWIVAESKANIYKVAYDESFKVYAPGTLLTAMLMEQVIEHDRVTEVDYLIGDDPYKKSWMSHRRERWGIIAYNPATLAGKVGHLREVAGRAIKPAVVAAKSIAIQLKTQLAQIRVTLDGLLHRFRRGRSPQDTQAD